MKTLVIVGAGPGLGLSLAKKFGGKHFNVALIARRKPELEKYVLILKECGINAAGFAADVTNEKQLGGAFSGIKAKFGQVDLLIYNAAVVVPSPVINTTAELVNKHLQVNVIGAVSSVQQVLPEMLERKDGAILFTGGGSSNLSAISFLTTLSIGKSGLRSYAHCLHDELIDKGIYVGMLSVAGVIKEGTDFAPDLIAESYYELYDKRDRVEAFFVK